MSSPLRTEFTSRLAGILCVLCAFSLQMQVTLFQSPTYLGLRLNATDILVPFAGIAILVTLLSGKSLWPTWQVPKFYHWLAALTVILVLAFINTYVSYGVFDQWAFVNKLCGWFVLMGILGLGGWISANASERQIKIFLKIFLYFALLVLFFQITVLIVQSYDFSQGWLKKNHYAAFPIEGLMANRNAYGLLLISTISISTALYFFKPDILSPAYHYALFFSIPFFIAFNGSRSTFMVLCILIPTALAINGGKWRKSLLLLVCLILGSGAFAGIFYDKPDEIVIFRSSQYRAIISVNEPEKEIKYDGDDIRLSVLKDALKMVRNHPLTGSGLGSAILYQKEKHEKIINLIDSTPLWILIETGAAGLTVFMLFYLGIIKTTYKAFKESDGLVRAFRLSFLYILSGFFLISLFHEITYTRFIWFFMGLALALPIRTRHAG